MGAPTNAINNPKKKKIRTRKVKQEEERNMTLIKKKNLNFLYALKQAATFFPLNKSQ
ncbi:MAG TPA: hypothetical protein VGC17_07355 [Lactovum miscens]|uniref:hypothetical protein n=1 Tax=Lactovum miscens TaxID=190387 RepID=UPI002EDACC87